MTWYAVSRTVRLPCESKGDARRQAGVMVYHGLRDVRVVQDPPRKPDRRLPDRVGR